RWSCSGGRCAGACPRDEPRLAPFTEIEPRLNELLQEFGTPSTRPSAQYPFWRLQGDGLWEVEAPVELARRRSNTDPKVTELRRDGVRGGFPEPGDRALRAAPEFRSGCPAVGSRRASRDSPPPGHLDDGRSGGGRRGRPRRDVRGARAA